jgi:hypothetical protein
MFRRRDVTLTSNPTCRNAANTVVADDFRYYDKDGFELNKAEQKFYLANSLPIIDCLNHLCWQEPWFELEQDAEELILDHCMFLCRANYTEDALAQLKELKSEVPTADLLMRTRQKWGFDFNLDAVSDDGTVYEVLHIEYDNYDFITFREQMLIFDVKVRHTDWHDCAKQVWNKRDEWQHLSGFAQNDWKSWFLLGWNKAEYTEKSV